MSVLSVLSVSLGNISRDRILGCLHWGPPSPMCSLLKEQCEKDLLMRFRISILLLILEHRPTLKLC